MDDIVLCRGVGGGDNVVLGLIGLIGEAAASALSFGADAVVAAIRRVGSGHGAKAIHLVGGKF